jgi:hypothetical protein
MVYLNKNYPYGGDPMSEEKRRFSRIPFRINAELTSNDKVLLVDEINNLSIGGGFFPIDELLAVGTSCRIELMLEGSSSELSIYVSGEVIRSLPEGVAIQFTRIDPDSLFHLQNIIRFNAPDPEVIEEEINLHPGLV